MTEVERLQRELARLQRRFERLERTARRQALFAERNKRLMFRSQAALRAEIELHERTAIELREAIERAEAATRAKSRFLANMSHEIRTPANAVVGLLDLISADAKDPQLEDRVEVAHTASRDLVAIVDDLLDLSEIEAEQTRLQIKRFAPWDAIDDTVAILAPAAGAKGLDLQVRIDPLPYWVNGDAGRFRQVLRNLLSNAIKFTETGRITVSCRFWDGQLISTVTDTGPGVPQELLARLFAPFDRLSQPNHGPKGRGLGLSIARQLARLMGGDVTVRSTTGVGSSFQFRCAVRPIEDDRRLELPPVHVAVRDKSARRHLLSILDDLGVVATSHASLTLTDRPHVPGVLVLDQTADAPHGSRPTLRRPLRRRAVEHLLSHLCGLPTETARPMRRPMRILLAEDNATNQLVASSMLRHLGCDVVIAQNGEEAVDMMDEGPFHLVLMDCRMPVMDGLAATEAIRTGELQPDVPIFALTAHALAGDEARCIAAGMNGYLTKPLRLQELRRLLDRQLGREAI